MGKPDSGDGVAVTDNSTSLPQNASKLTCRNALTAADRYSTRSVYAFGTPDINVHNNNPVQTFIFRGTV